MSRRPDEGRTSQRAFRIHRVERDLDEELAFHFAETVEELVAGGMSREEAEAEARRRFGDESRYRAEIEATDRGIEARRRRRDIFGTAAQTLHYALRSVRRSPGLSAGIVLTLALGIGANATMFSTIDRLLLRAPDHIREPETVWRLQADRWVRDFGERRLGRISYQDYLDLRDAPGFPEVAAYTSAGGVLGEGLAARPVIGWAVTGSFWDVLGVRPHLGRFFTEEDDDPDGEWLVVLGYDLWQGAFGGEPEVIGRSVRLDVNEYRIVGVAPRGFTGAELDPNELWLPFHQRFHGILGPASGGAALGRGMEVVDALVRLAPTVAPERVAEQATGIHLAGREAIVGAGNEDGSRELVLAPVGRPSRVNSFRPGVSADPIRDGRVALWLGGVSAIVLLIACANVANLLLARFVRHRREAAIRLALGVSRRRLVAQHVVDGLVLASLGGALALAITQWGGWILQRTLLPGVHWSGPVTRRVLLFGIAATVAVGLLSALAPSIHASRFAARGAQRAMSGALGRSSGRVQAWLVTVQAALSVILLVGAGLFLQSLGRAQATELGFDAERVLLVEPWYMSAASLDNRAPDALRFGERIFERLPGFPDVEAVAWGDPPLRGGSTPRLGATRHDSVAGPDGGAPRRLRVQGDYFRALGLEILEGRPLRGSDEGGAEPVTVVSRAMARHLWPDGDALGKCLFIAGSETCARVVGVASDVRVRSIAEAMSLAYYVPAEYGGTTGFFIVRTRGDPARSVDAIRRELMAMDAQVRYVHAETLAGDVVGLELRSWRLGATLFTAFGLLAATLAAIGLYSVLAFDVEQSRREIGLRTALGASRDRVVSSFVQRATKLTATGSLAGLTVALVLAPRIEPLLFQTSARDPSILGGVAVALMLVGVAAAGIPAWRATRVDPNVVLREE